MSEINNNDIKFIHSSSCSIPKVETETNSLEFDNEFKNDNEALNKSLEKAGMIGRSQVNNIDNIKKDIAFFAQNPKLVETINTATDNYYENLVKENAEEPYEKSCSMTKVMAQELKN